jgi:serine/threonine protein kinase
MESIDNELDEILKKIYSVKKSIDKKEYITNCLNDIGLYDLKLDTIENINCKIKQIITDIDIKNCAIFKKMYLNNTGKEKMGLFLKDGSTQRIIQFDFINDLLTKGHWNKIQLYRDNTGKEYIFRCAIKKKELQCETEDEYLFRSFYENLKHMVLYYILKYHNLDKQYKVIPEIYYFGIYCDTSTNEKTFITVMEKGEQTLGDYFMTKPLDYNEMCKKLLMVYKTLELFNNLGLNFKHGDLKYNNILINDNVPVLIDFGNSHLQLDDLILEPSNNFSAHYNNPKLNITHDMMQLLSSLFIPKKISFDTNISNDINDYMINVYKIFSFKKNKNKFIMDGDVMKKIILNKCNKLFITHNCFYRTMMGGFNLNNLVKEFPNISFTITYDELAENLEITL